MGSLKGRKRGSAESAQCCCYLRFSKNLTRSTVTPQSMPSCEMKWGLAVPLISIRIVLVLGAFLVCALFDPQGKNGAIRGNRSYGPMRDREEEEEEKMASLTMLASFLGGVSAADRPAISHRRSLVVAKAATTSAEAAQVDAGKPAYEARGESSGRRAVMFAAAAATVCAVGQGMASAGEEPERGTPEAKKKYAPVCVTMPTARICRK
ncbi:hypothetical protein Cni_G01109 [Canna indica]|uniref:Photosystem II 5 kDa protein, chloroplastic n=1 Tax=Canna indica TaxID=4628 RepID=A0AAQ3JM43_9LILI|nr:hypothetical protein Cni_G01109 [Canna indica]